MTTPAGVFQYGYDADGRASSLIDPCGHTYGWSYLPNSWLNSQVQGNGAVSTYSYNAWGSLTDLKNTNSTGSILSEFSGMRYDAAVPHVPQEAGVCRQ